MGCNTSQELKTGEAAVVDAATVNNGEIQGAGEETGIKENGDNKSDASEQNNINHTKLNVKDDKDKTTTKAVTMTNSDSSIKKSNGVSNDVTKAVQQGHLNRIDSEEQQQHQQTALHNGIHKDNNDISLNSIPEFKSQNYDNDDAKFTYNFTSDTDTNHYQHKPKEFRDYEDEEKAATKIQAVFRGHQVRRSTTMKKSDYNSSTTANNGKNADATDQNGASATDTQPTKAELEAEFDPNDKELCNAASKIQATFRGHMQRKLVNKDAPDDEDIEEITKKVAEELDIDLTDPELNKAATKIQASFRGHKTRKEAAQ